MAAELSWPLRRAILSLDGKEFADWASVLRQRNQRIKLNNLGITEPCRDGPVTSWFLIRLTQKGLALKEWLRDSDTQPKDGDAKQGSARE
jgi:hypothetical protein